MEAEDGGGGGLGGGELPGVDGVDDGARVAQLDAAAHAIAPARPPAQQTAHFNTRNQLLTACNCRFCQTWAALHPFSLKINQVWCHNPEILLTAVYTGWTWEVLRRLDRLYQ